MNNYRLFLISVIIVSSIVSSTSYAAQVGEIKYARGAVTVQQHDGSSVRLVGKGDKIQQGEVIKTGSKSFAIVNLADDTRMTLRPKTSFAVESMNAEKSSKATALLRLFKGGLRAITGFISKKNPHGYKIQTTVATIGIRGTEFDARLCAEDCMEENKALEEKIRKKQEKVVGRVVYKRGKLDAYDLADKHRALDVKSDLLAGDMLSTGENSYAVIVFRDKSRIALQALTDFRIDELQFNKTEKSKMSALFSLLRGGLRTATGLIGKLSPKSYSMRTRVATIGIRGTGYDLLCNGACAGLNPEQSNLPEGEGLYAHVWNGAIQLGDKVINLGQAAFVKDVTSGTQILPEVPDVFINNPVPRPDDKQFDDVDFAEAEAQTIEPGLYVSVSEGEVTVSADKTGATVSIAKGEAAYANADAQTVKQLPSIPVFQEMDQYPTPDNYQSQISQLSETTIGGQEDNTGVTCEIK